MLDFFLFGFLVIFDQIFIVLMIIVYCVLKFPHFYLKSFGHLFKALNKKKQILRFMHFIFKVVKDINFFDNLIYFHV